jgi:hypothetical protein
MMMKASNKKDVETITKFVDDILCDGLKDCPKYLTIYQQLDTVYAGAIVYTAYFFNELGKREYDIYIDDESHEIFYTEQR